MKIYTPPLISAKQNITIGHGVNLTYCDVLHRLSLFKGDVVHYLFPSWNHHGKRTEKLELSLEEVLGLEKDLELRLEPFKLQSSQFYRDTDEKSKIKAQETFRRLYDKQFIVQKEGKLFLDVQKIFNETGFLEFINNANYYPKKSAKGRMLALCNTINDLYPISKPREFATRIPDGLAPDEEKINPIFDIAISPSLFDDDTNDYCIDGNRTLLHGTFIPFLVWAALLNKPFSKNVNIHGYLIPDNNLGFKTPTDFISSHHVTCGKVIGIESDMLRYCVLQSTNSQEDLRLDKSRIQKARMVLLRTLNIAKHLAQNYKINRDHSLDEEIDREIGSMNIVGAIEIFSKKIFRVSKNIADQTLNENDIRDYLGCLNAVEILFPDTFNFTVRNLAKYKL
jgi:methionyl-tRNA synthetase